MRILIYEISFLPELTGIGKYTGEMAVWLARQGCEVRVIAAPPFYPQWKVHAGYSGLRYRREEIEGLRVYRCPIWVPRKPTGTKRLLHLFSFALSSLPVVFLQWFWRPQVVLAIEPSLFTTPAALTMAKLCGARTWLHVQDLEVDAGFELGLVSSGRLKGVVLGVERWLLDRFDRVSTISVRMLERLRSKGVPSSKSLLFPNWADIEGIVPLLHVSSFRASCGIGAQDVVALYSGNMGFKQGMELLVEVARRLVSRPGIHFVLCGDGSMRETLVRMAEGLPNVQFLPLQPVERLGELLGMADIHLLPQKSDAADLVLPSKLTGMLASGRCVLATAEQGTELDRLVNVCGVVVPPDQPGLFVDALLRLADDAQLRADLGARGRRFAEANLARDTILSRFLSMLRHMVRPGEMLRLHEPSPLPASAPPDNNIKQAA